MTRTHIPRRRRAALAALAAVSTIVTLLPMQAAAGPTLAQVPTSSADPIDCVLHALGQGLPLASAIEECKVVLQFQGVGVGTGGVQIIGMSFGTTTGLSSNVSCGSASVDPRLAGDLDDARKARDDAKSELDEFLKWLDNNAPLYGKEAHAADKLREFLTQRVNDTQAAYEAAKLQRTVEGANACDAISSFLQDCSLAAWKTGPCQLFTQRLEGCAEATIARTDGEPGSGCRLPEPDEETVKEVVELICSKIGKVAPDTDPCDPTAGLGFTYIITDPAEDPCPADEHGYHTGECPGVEWEPGEIIESLTPAIDWTRLGGPGAPDGVDGPSGPGDPKY